MIKHFSQDFSIKKKSKLNIKLSKSYIWHNMANIPLCFSVSITCLLTKCKRSICDYLRQKNGGTLKFISIFSLVDLSTHSCRNMNELE